MQAHTAKYYKNTREMKQKRAFLFFSGGRKLFTIISLLQIQVDKRLNKDIEKTKDTINAVHITDLY